MTMFNKVFGEGPQVKLIDFLVANPEEELSKTQMAQGSKITRPTLYKLLDELLAEELVIKTRKVGNIQLYQTNNELPLIKHLTSLQELLLDREMEKRKEQAPSMEKKQSLDYFY